MNEQQRNALINNMAENLPVLRKKLGMTQNELAGMVGVSRSTLASIEGKKRNMTWNMFLSLLLVFTKNKETDKLLSAMEIYTDEFNEFIKSIAKRNEEKT